MSNHLDAHGWKQETERNAWYARRHGWTTNESVLWGQRDVGRGRRFPEYSPHRNIHFNIHKHTDVCWEASPDGPRAFVYPLTGFGKFLAFSQEHQLPRLICGTQAAQIQSRFCHASYVEAVIWQSWPHWWQLPSSPQHTHSRWDKAV